MKKLDIYKFKPDEMRELTFTELKVLAVLRQLSQESKIDYRPNVMAEKIGITTNQLLKAITGLSEKKKLSCITVGKKHEVAIISTLAEKEQYLFFDLRDFRFFSVQKGESKLTYNEFKIFALIRSYYAGNGYKPYFGISYVQNITGIGNTNIYRVLDSLNEKSVLQYFGKEITGNKPQWSLCEDWNYVKLRKKKAESD
ncbi:hypothetical protein BACCAP_01081 [Pseudoflavonifractor capillosus ATCC 29799]|uniref:Uncharacterized protein n=1 Tax=Pseudoflavonifractor capillosus ATCC 29799 TaxID=411467 RepID=A6NSA2_9FIRM|nr:hypothetical protein [Pseudoflavonifractor capillosus]EDN01140.1 hypothetical protein BACCAP_01081 [Pseudoflavonifractor capillosus ATCC 29799]